MTAKAVAMLVAFTVAIISPATNAAVYKVGDATGWTTIGNFDYKQWSSTKAFRLGDVIIFKYVPQFHNVMQVTHKDYKSCNASSPIATHTTGNDSITITKHGHHFFLCGVPGHCQSGQKVDINVRLDTSMAPTPDSSSVKSTSAKPAAMAPGPSSFAPSSTASNLKALIGVVFVGALVSTTFFV